MSPAPAVATTRDRIRDAALELFGRDGFDGASVRDIAQHAGVSPALVMHHFGSKEALRAECDSVMLDEVLGREEQLLGEPSADMASTMQRWLADVESHRVSLDYLARMITDGTPAGAQLFDDLVSRTRTMIDHGIANGMMRESSDDEMTAVIVAAYGLVPLLLERHLGRAVGEQGLSPSLVRRMTLPILELYTHGLYRTTAILDAATAALEGDPATSRGPHSDKGAGDPNQDPDPPAAAASDT